MRRKLYFLAVNLLLRVVENLKKAQIYEGAPCAGYSTRRVQIKFESSRSR
jgi:hypothetical protein